MVIEDDVKTGIVNMKKVAARIERIQQEKHIGFNLASFFNTAEIALSSLLGTLKESIYWAEIDKDYESGRLAKNILDYVEKEWEILHSLDLSDDKSIALLHRVTGFAFGFADLLSMVSFFDDCEMAEKAGMSLEKYYERNNRLSPEHLKKLQEIYGEQI